MSRVYLACGTGEGVSIPPRRVPSATGFSLFRAAFDYRPLWIRGSMVSPRLYGRPCSGSTQRSHSSGAPPTTRCSVFFRIKWKMFFRATRQTLYRVPSAAHRRAYVLKINILGCRWYRGKWRSLSRKQFNGIRGNTIEEVRRGETLSISRLETRRICWYGRT